MRPVRQLKIITSQLELLEDLKQQLDSLLAYIHNVLKIGESWIERKDDTQTFLEVNMLLAKETSNCIQKCLEIARENQELFQTSSDLNHDNDSAESMTAISTAYNLKGDSEYQGLLGKMNEAENTISSLLVSTKSNEENCTALCANYHKLNNLTNTQSEKMNKLNEQLASQEKLMASFLKKQEEMDIKFRSQIDGISKELLSSRNSEIHYQGGIESAKKGEKTERKLNHDLFEDEPDFWANLATSSVKHPIKDTSSMKHPLQETSWKVASSKIKDTPVAFDASVDDLFGINVKKDQILSCFNFVIFNRGNYYNPKTGIFTSPACGLYMCSLFVDTNLLQDTQFCVCRKTMTGSESVVVNTHVRSSDTMVSDTGLVEMNVNDQLYVKVLTDCCRLKLNFYTHFLCVLVHRYY